MNAMVCNCHGMVYLDCPNYRATRVSGDEKVRQSAREFWDKCHGIDDSPTKVAVKGIACEFAEAYAAAENQELEERVFQLTEALRRAIELLASDTNLDIIKALREALAEGVAVE